jgi:uncharacterized protein GlcG (DUF336 family)
VAHGIIAGGIAVAGALTGENDELIAWAALKILVKGKMLPALFEEYLQ